MNTYLCSLSLHTVSVSLIRAVNCNKTQSTRIIRRSMKKCFRKVNNSSIFLAREKTQNEVIKDFRTDKQWE